MRPVRLELEGFTAFRDRTVVDFDGADLFALTGPTGAGKSSVIDAMIFALYGVVPRFDDARLVGAVVSQGRNEGRVRLDFAVGGQPWTAVRVVRLRDGKATTKEARLERNGEVVAGTAKELDAAVAELLGLSAGQFTTCVVLPQGQFARFLQAKPADRQDLLVRLLELGLYDAIREAAGQRAGKLEGELAAVRAHLDALAAATPEALVGEKERLVRFEAALSAVEECQPELAAVDTRRRALEGSRAELDHKVRQLAAVRAPADTGALADRAAAARRSLDAAEQAELSAAGVLADARVGREAAGERGPLEGWERAYAERPDARARREAAAGALNAAQADQAAAVAAAGAAASEARAAEARYDQVVAENRAAALRAHLVPGEPCPVCEQVVLTVPPHGEPAEVGAARTARQQSQAAEAAATDAVGRAGAAVALAQDRDERAGAEVAAVTARLEDAPSQPEVEALRAALDRADSAVAAAQAAHEDAAARRRKAATDQAGAVEAEQAGWAAFDRLRDGLSALGPPTVDRASLGGAWQELAAWAEARRPQLDEERRVIEAAAADLDEERRRIVEVLDGLVTAAGLIVDGRAHRDVLVDARAQSRQAASVLAEALAERERLAGEEAQVARQAQVANALKLELQANRFEKWVLDHVLRDLCTTASTLLRRLSQSAYSLALDERAGFVVVDHRNADEVRLARTLSGGETFLASLALALALAEQVAQSGRGAAHLESLFLDEGFGTLDAATLDVVASAIEDLGAAGRMVGLVSHVAELAERVPVRFEVSRGLRSSTVERIER